MDIAEFATAVFGMILQAAQQDTWNTLSLWKPFRLVCFVWLSVLPFHGRSCGRGARPFLFFQLLLQGIAVHFLLFFVKVVIAAVASQSVAGEFANGG